MKHSGNYEAIYGMVTHFKWSFGTDGSYNCEVRIIGMGNIIESLKLNVTDPKKEEEKEEREITYNKTLKQFISGKFGYTVGGLINNKVSKDKWSDRNKKYMVRATKEELTVDASLNAIKKWAKDKYEEKKAKVIKVKTFNINNNPVLANRDDTRLNKVFYDIYSIILGFEGDNGGIWGTQQIDNGIFLLNDTLNGEIKMDYEMIILYGAIGIGVALAAYKTYQRLMADGKIDIKEILGLAKDLQEIADTLPSMNEIKKMKKAELIALCEENGLDTAGVKADLLGRLEKINIPSE